MVRLVAAASAFLMVSFMLAGCTDGDGGDETTGSSAPWTPPADPCLSVTDATSVPSWTKHGGQWGPVASQEGHIDVVCGKATGSLQSLVNDLAGPYGDVEAKVTFNMLLGDWGLTEDTLDKSDAGAGLVIHYADAGNYTIVRYSPRENGWHLFTMIDGNRQKRDEGSVTPPTTNPEYHEWVELRVVSEGAHVTAFDGTTKVIDYDLPAGASRNGRVGYFLRDAGMATLFDDFSAIPLA